MPWTSLKLSVLGNEAKKFQEISVGKNGSSLGIVIAIIIIMMMIIITRGLCSLHFTSMPSEITSAKDWHEPTNQRVPTMANQPTII